MDLKYVKEDSPIKLSEYAVVNKIDDDLDFAWWVHYVFKKQYRIISKAKTKYWRTTHEYGIRIPKTEAEALELDRQAGQPVGIRLERTNPTEEYFVIRLKKF